MSQDPIGVYPNNANVQGQFIQPLSGVPFVNTGPIYPAYYPAAYDEWAKNADINKKLADLEVNKEHELAKEANAAEKTNWGQGMFSFMKTGNNNALNFGGNSGFRPGASATDGSAFEDSFGKSKEWADSEEGQAFKGKVKDKVSSIFGGADANEGQGGWLHNIIGSIF